MERRTWVPLVLVSMLGLALRLVNLNGPSLWLDEIYQVLTVRENWIQLFHGVALHMSPPLDYVLLKIFTSIFGTSDFVVRLPACLYGTLSIILLYTLVKRIANHETALFSALLLAISPMAIAFAQETRMYSLFLLLSIISLNVLIRYLDIRSLSNAALLGITNGLLLLTHYFGFIIVGLEILGFVIWRVNRRQFKTIYYEAVCVGISCVMFAPWIPFLLKQIQQSGGEIWYGLESNLYYFKVIFSRFSSDTGYDDFWFYVFGVLFLGGAWLAWQEKNWRLLILAVSLPMVLLILFIASSFKKVVTPRNLIFLLPIYLVLIGQTWAWLRTKLRLSQTVAALLLIAIMAWPVFRYYAHPRPDYKPDWKRAADYISKNAGPDEVVGVPDRLTRYSLAYYLDAKTDYDVNSTLNLPGQKIKIISSQEISEISEPGSESWIVIPPTIIGKPAQERDLYLAQLPEPVSKFSSQGKPLSVYRLYRATK